MLLLLRLSKIIYFCLKLFIFIFYLWVLRLYDAAMSNFIP